MLVRAANRSLSIKQPAGRLPVATTGVEAAKANDQVVSVKTIPQGGRPRLYWLQTPQIVRQPGLFPALCASHCPPLERPEAFLAAAEESLTTAKSGTGRAASAG
jgi:hypothetical protein